ncbi:MAG: DUF2997 domain-containing protein [Chloracidobacterium sp.]|nr:DUF2997 domain-containing protein [Chloracidobacterium sp.]MBK7804243.1 DUF2997 domain-containing protein [Chloracidobacterium sp.]MBL0239505.1 DUF2997 domain-containing protein [Chloracidobacterium sp.]
MPEVEFKIDTERGTCETEIKGYQGVACEKAARQLKEVLGDPSAETKKPEYFVKRMPKLTSKRK